MPEFILDTGSAEHAARFNALDAFTQGYIEALFFTDCEAGSVREAEDDFSRVWDPETDSSLPGNVGFGDLVPQALAMIVADCARFQAENAALLDAARELEAGSEGLRYAREALDDRRLGQLFWYARNGHGVAFTDDGDSAILKALQVRAQGFRHVDSCIGDDGRVYLM